MTKVERHILGLIANGLCGSILQEGHPVVQHLVACGYAERSIDGLRVTDRGMTAMGTEWTSGTRAMGRAADR